MNMKLNHIIEIYYFLDKNLQICQLRRDKLALMKITRQELEK